jgi:thioredoxin 1
MSGSRGSRRGLIEIICQGIVVGLLFLSGCALGPTAKDKSPAEMKSSPASATSSVVRRTGSQVAATPTPQAGPAGTNVSLNEVPESDPPASLSARPQGAALISSDMHNAVLQPPPSYPPVRLVSDESALPPAQAPAPQSPTRRLEAARLDARPVGKPTPPTVVHANETTFEQQVIRSDVPVLVDFYAGWCVPCKKLAPTLEEVATESPQAKVVKVNIDDSPELAARYGVRSVPSLIVFKDGQVVARQSGVVGKARLKSLLDL